MRSGKRNKLIAALVLIGSVGAYASSHREAPAITEAPKIDGTDFYMFRSYESGRDAFVTLVANYYPFQDPFGGPNYFSLDTDAVYEIHIDNNGDAVEDLTFQFRPAETYKNLAVPVGGMMVPVPVLNIGPIGPGRNDTGNLNREESYAVNLIRGPRRAGVADVVTNVATGMSTFQKPVDNIGTKTLPQYETYANNHIYDIAIPGCGNGRMFVGQRKDPFMISVGEVFDLVNISNPIGSESAEEDDLADKNITSFVLEVPISCLVSSSSQPIIGGWTTASLGVGATGTGGGGGATSGACLAGQPSSPKPADSASITWVPDQSCMGWVPAGHPQARSGAGAGAGSGGSGSGGTPVSNTCSAGQPSSPKPPDNPGLTWVPNQSCTGWVPSTHPEARGASGGGTGAPGAGAPGAGGMQVSRLGSPLVNEVVIGLPDKDLFNSAHPTQDTALASYVTNPTLPELLEILFGSAGVQAPNNFPRGDLVAAFLTGISGLNQPPGVVASEMLRLNTSIAPVAAAMQSRLGALGGDNAGFPNGRRPGDDVVDIELRVAMGALCHAFPGAFGCGPADAPSGLLPFTDGVLVDASRFNSTFPYIRTPLPGAPNSYVP